MNIKWTDKTQAITTGAVAAVMGFIGWLAAIPPEQQSGVLGSLVSVFPLTWQPAIGLWAKSLFDIVGYLGSL